MSAEAVLAAAWVLNPGTVRRAQRLVQALALVNQGVSRGDACLILQQQFVICQSEAWRLDNMARDLTSAAKKEA